MKRLTGRHGVRTAHLSFLPAFAARTAHLFVLVTCLALAAYAASFLLGDPSAPAILMWFLGAAVAFDLVLFPLSALADRLLIRLPRSRVPLVNHVRLPLLGAGLTFVMFLPGILRQSEPTHLAATGLNQQPYLARWLWLVLTMFLLSAAIYLIRVAISRPAKGNGRRLRNRRWSR